MSYIVFARKYRPQNFDDIEGQSHITTTLKNAISQGRVAHAYLFAGPRGVGKTTTARILAKALNCEKGPTVKPCNSCRLCEEITQGSSLDILEIDGASNRGIDEIRNLRENVKFAPSKGSFKIYIIDEVHMLTSEAFNALLKTLEEPPKHVKFIFATTQVYKVPPTILSRCQRFDFRRISAKDIFKNLKMIIKAEKLSVDDDVLSLIAKCSDGSLRDGQVILDQIVSSVKGKVSLSEVSKMLGVIDEEVISGLAGALLEKNPAAALKLTDGFINEGKDVVQVIYGLIEYYRNLSVAKITKNADSLIDASAEEIKHYEAESKKYTVEQILYIIYTLSNTLDFVRKTNMPRIPFEAAMIKLARSGPVVPLDEVISRISELEKKLGKTAGACQQYVKPEVREIKAEAPASVPQSSVDADLEEILSSWASIINYVRAKKISIASYLDEGYPVSFEKNTISIGFPKEHQFHKEMLELPENKKLVEEAFRMKLKIEPRIAFIFVEPVNLPAKGAGKNSERDTTEEPSSPDDEAGSKEMDPILKTAMEIFGGEISNKDNRRPRAR